MTREQAVIKVDIDSDSTNVSITQPRVRNVTRILRRAGYRPIALTFNLSPSGHGWHMVIHVSPRPKSPYEVVALQLLLGSDPNREAMQFHRARSFVSAPAWMRDMWNVLYLPHPQRIRHLTLENE